MGNDIVSLDRLAELLGPVPGALVHLGRCSVLRRNEDAAHRLLRSTRARLLSGYESDVDWLDSAALDLAWLGYAAQEPRLGDAERKFRKRYAAIIEHLRWHTVAATS